MASSKDRVVYVLEVEDGFSKVIGKAKKQTKGLKKEVEGTGSPLKSLAGLAGGAFAAFQAFDAIKGIAQLGVDMEQTRVAFTTFLGSADEAGRVIEDLNKFSNVTPFEPEQAIQAGKSLLAFGTEADALIPTLKAIGDISAGTGKDFNELATIFGKAQIAGTLYAEDINQLVEAGVPIIGEFAKQLGVTEGEVKKLASEGKISFSNLQQAFGDLTNEGGLFFDLMDKQSQTVGGRISTLVGVLKNIGVSIGEFILPVLGSMVDGLQTTVNWIQENADGLARVFEPVTNQFKGFLSILDNVREELFGTADATEFLETTFNALGSALEFISPIFEVLLDLFSEVYSVIIEVVQAIGSLIGQNEAVKNSLGGLFFAVRGVFVQIAQSAKTLIGGVGDLLVGIFTGNIDKIKEGGLALVDAVKEGNIFALGKTAGEEFQKGFKADKTLTDFFPDKQEIEQEEGPQKNILDFLGPGSPSGSTPGGAGSSSSGGIGSGVGSTRAAAKPTNINVTIEKIIGIENLVNEEGALDLDTIGDKVAEVLVTAVNDVNLIAK